MRAMARRPVARFGRNRSFRRRLPPELGGAVFYASTEGGLKYLRRRCASIDPMLLRFATRFVRPGASVWDVGANVGLFTFAAAGLAGASGSVVAVEPDAWLVQNLRRSSRTNHPPVADVHVLPVAIAAGSGVARFNVANNSRAANFLEGRGSTVTGGSREAQFVPTLALDALLDRFPAPDVLKVDVEGAEMDVLVGASRVLSQSRPVVLIEVGASAEVTSLLAGHSYRLFDAETEPPAPVDAAVYNTLALPEEDERARG